MRGRLHRSAVFAARPRSYSGSGSRVVFPKKPNWITLQDVITMGLPASVLISFRGCADVFLARVVMKFAAGICVFLLVVFTVGSEHP